MNPFHLYLYLLIVISLALTIVTCFSPDGRFGQASVLIGDKLYFFGGNTMNPSITNQVFYLNLSSSFNTLLPPWSQITISPIPILLVSTIPCLSTDGSTVFLVGGASQDPLNASSTYIRPPASVYAFNFNNSQWTTPNIDNFNSTFLGRVFITGIGNSDGKYYFFGGYKSTLLETTTRFYYNDTNIFDTKTMKWLTLTLPNTLLGRALYSAVLKDNLIIYTGGVGYYNTFDMNEIPVFDTVTLQWLFMEVLGDSIESRSGHSAVLTQDGLIIIYGGVGPTHAQVQPDIAILNVSFIPYTWKAITDKAPQSLMYHSSTLYGIYMIAAFGAKVGIGISVAVAVSIMIAVGFLIYNVDPGNRPLTAA
ncbi:galactose oxidase [Gigaspora margarita]|uniref:Galactose oxidase n=1 Tax=Gigaspora margarita TaxID=4874 RepID=A0A8H4EUX0_GIGMA|nr:galactose oxidase [Gigaspora margarita]